MSKAKPRQDLVSTPEPARKRDPRPAEAEAIKGATDYYLSRAQPLAYEVASVEGKTINVSIPHSDRVGFVALQCATFGTASPAFANQATGELAAVLRSSNAAGPTQEQLNSGVAAVAGIAPKDETEAMLAVQMTGTHAVAMEMLTRARHANTTDGIERYGTLATKLLRTYTAQVEVLAKLRRKGEQTVRVEHVHVYQGGQAIVGNVTSGQGGGLNECGHQPHGPTDPRALALAPVGTLLCQDAARDGVPVARDEGEKAVPDPRRRGRKRGARG